MKLKRFLALALSLAMVLTIVPAFGLTASAATETVLFDVANLTISGEQNISMGGWTASESGAAVRWNQYWGTNGVWGSTGTYALMFFFANSRGSSDGNVTATINNGADTDCASKVTVDFNFATQEVNNIYQTWNFRDVDGNTYAKLAFDRNNTVRLGCNSETVVTDGSGTSAVYGFRGTNIKIVSEKVSNTEYTVTYFVAGEKKVEETVSSANGFGSILANVPKWNDQYSAAGLQDLKITYEMPETAKDVTATYTVNGETVKTVTKTYDSSTATGANFDAVYYSVNGENVLYKADARELSESTEIELTAVENWGSYDVNDVFANGGKQYEVKSKNLVPNGNFEHDVNGWFNRPGSEITGATVAYDEAVSGNAMTISTSGAGATNSIGTKWSVETGKTYYLSFYVGGSKPTSGNYQYNKVFYGDGSTEIVAYGADMTDGAWKKFEKVFTAAQDTILFQGSWAANIKYANVELYEIEEAQTAVTETVASVADIAPVKVIGDTNVVLPATVKVTGDLGSVVDAAIAWNAPTTYNVGTTTVSGKATVKFGDQDATEEDVEIDVTVLAETFALADLASGGSDNVSYFPVAIADEFTLQFDMTASNYDNLWIYISNNGALWGGGQIGLGWDNNGDGYFRAQPANQTSVQFATGKTYRFFVTGNAATDKYSLTVLDVEAKTIIIDVKDYGFRSNSDVINSIAFTPNGENGVGTMSNIKVNANVSKTEYTFNITIDGTTNTTTGSYWTLDAAKASLADVPGYEKTITVDGTTINVVYSATQTLKATFVDADENVIKTVEEIVAIGETYKVNEEEIFFLDADYTGHIYAIPETVLSADNNNLVVTVNDVADKYPAMEDALVSDNEIWGIKKTNNNSVFVAGGADANQAPLVDANGVSVTDGTHTPSTLGKSRVGFVQFPVVDFEEGQKVTANFYVRAWHDNGFSNQNTSLRLAAYAVNDDSWTALSDGGKYDSANAPLLSTWATPVFSDVCYKNVGYITFDITEIMAAAKAAGLETITLRLNAPYGAAYIAEREACVTGGAYAGKVAYVKVEDAGLVKVTETGRATLTKNGSEMNGFAYVTATDDVRLNATGAIVVGTDAGYYEANKTMSITAATAFENTAPATLGLDMVEGAQVRIGNTNLGAGEKLDAMADSGIRFIATADYNGTVVVDSDVEFGIKVQADASDNVSYVKATKFQNDEKTAFSTAIVNLLESNYNRKYTATAYAKVPMADGSVKEFNAPKSVTRSIYQVSAGIMKNGKADAEDAPYTVEGVVKNVLNAYINQTGIRLTYANGEMTVEDGKYTGDVFFTVESVEEDGATTVTITPDATWGTKAEIAEWWTDYVRVNNNNSTAKTYISNASVDGDGVLTFTFTVPAE